MKSTSMEHVIIWASQAFDVNTENYNDVFMNLSSYQNDNVPRKKKYIYRNVNFRFISFLE